MVFFKPKIARDIAKKRKRTLKLRRLDAEAELLGKRARVEKFKTQITRARRARTSDFKMKFQKADRNFTVSDREFKKESVDERIGRIF